MSDRTVDAQGPFPREDGGATLMGLDLVATATTRSRKRRLITATVGPAVAALTVSGVALAASSVTVTPAPANPVVGQTVSITTAATAGAAGTLTVALQPASTDCGATFQAEKAVPGARALNSYYISESGDTFTPMSFSYVNTFRSKRPTSYRICAYYVTNNDSAPPDAFGSTTVRYRCPAGKRAVGAKCVKRKRRKR
jgi:hypothetical protein